MLTFSLGIHGDFLHDHIREESGYHLRAHPFYNFATFQDYHQFQNSTITNFSRLQKKSLQTILVDSFGAKGDGISDDSQVI